MVEAVDVGRSHGRSQFGDDSRRELNKLSQDEYHQSLNEVAADPDLERAVRRIGRLGGVLMKQPFADRHEHEAPSEHNQAFTSYQLLSAEDFEATAQTGPLQYRTLKAMHAELASQAAYLAGYSTHAFAEEAQNELGWFGCLAYAVRPYVCGDAPVRKAIDEALESSRRQGVQVATPETIMLSTGLSLGLYLVENVPVMEHASPALVAVVVVTLHKLGVQRFCDWSRTVRTDSDEKRIP